MARASGGHSAARQLKPCPLDGSTMRRAIITVLALAIVTGCVDANRPAAHASERDSTTWPTSVQAAADTLLATFSLTDRARLAALPRDSLVLLHMTLGMGIRNDYGLWRGNLTLLHSCGQDSLFVPDDCSMQIIIRAWERLNHAVEPPN